MVYEELYLAAMRRNRSKGMKEAQVKGVIADMVRRQLRPNDFHRRLMTTSGCRHVLTTNYDYNLEEACTGPFPLRRGNHRASPSVHSKRTFITGQLDPVERVPFVNETVHSLFRRHEVPLTEGGGQPTPLHSTS